MGRGPTNDISPRTTCHSCGNSSIEYLRQKEAKPLVTLGSSAFLISGAAAVSSRSMRRPLHGLLAKPPPHMVRSFSTQNSLPFQPTRACATRGGRRDSRRTISPAHSSKGDKTNSSAKAATRSAIATGIHSANC